MGDLRRRFPQARVVLGLHYPSDVLAATAIGMSLASLTLWLTPGVTLF